MRPVTRPFDTDAPARPVAPGHVLARAIVRAALAVFALLLVADLSPTVAAPAAPPSVRAVAAGCDAVRSPATMIAPITIEADDTAHESAPVGPLANARLRVSGCAFAPPRSAIVPARGPSLPERPPRRA